MRVHFPDAVVFDDPAVFDSLNRLFARADQGVHELSFADVDGLMQSALWKEGLAPYKQREWLSWLAVGADFEHRNRKPGAPPATPHVLVVRAGVARPVLPALRQIPVGEIGAWSETPLRLLLENKRDLKLLIGAARAYEGTLPGGKTWVELAESDRALHVDGRGGCGEVWTTVRDLVDPNDTQVRIFVAIDSDCLGPGKGRGNAQRDIERWGEEYSRSGTHHEIQVRILNKREIENYVPRTQLHARATSPDQKRKFRSWDRLTDEEKDYDDIKARFGEKWTADCLSAMGEEPPHFNPGDLDARAGQELRELLAALKEKL